jgi:uncharacterized membrane protein
MNIPPTSLHRQRGAIGVMAALVILISFLFMALAIDSGRLWLAKRDLQQIADISAMTAANRIGCDAHDLGAIQDAAQAAAVANGYAGNLTAAPNTVGVGFVETDATGLRAFTGMAPPLDPVGNEQIGVMVRATESVPASLVAGGLFGEQISIAADAVALSRAPQASFSVGSGLLSLTDDGALNALLGALLGQPVGLDLVTYQGIAQTSVSIFDLIKAGLAVGTVNEVLDASVEIGQLLQVTATALSQKAIADVGLTTGAGGAQAIADLSISPARIRLADILDVDLANGDAAANVQINAFDLITAALFAANSSNALSLDAAVLGVPGVSGIGASLRVIEPPKIAVGVAGTRADGDYCTVARTAQVRLGVPIYLNVLGLVVVDLGLSIRVAQSEAGLEAIDIGPDSALVDIATTPGIASIQVTNAASALGAALDDDADSLPPGEISLLLGLLRVPLGVNVPLENPQPTTLSFDVAYPAPASLPSATQRVETNLQDAILNALVGESADIDLKVVVLGITLLDLGSLVEFLLDVLAPLLAPILGLVENLLSLLGIQLGTADVTLNSIKSNPAGLLVI